MHMIMLEYINKIILVLYLAFLELIRYQKFNDYFLLKGKMTWFVKANAELERHLSMVAIPKLIKCYDCDKNFHRDELVCDCSTSPMAAYGAAVQAQGLLRSFHEKKIFFLHHQLFVYIFMLLQVDTVNTEIVNVIVWRLIQDWNTDLKRWPIFKINPYYISHFVYFVMNNV